MNSVLAGLAVIDNRAQLRPDMLVAIPSVKNREILNEELEKCYGRGVRLLCESLAPPAQAGERVPGGGETPGGPEASLVDRIVELFDGEVLGPDPEKGNV